MDNLRRSRQRHRIGHKAQDGRQTKVVGGDPNKIRPAELQKGPAQAVPHKWMDTPHQQAACNPEQNATRRRKTETNGDRPGEMALSQHGKRSVEEQKRGGIVEEAFALEDRVRTLRDGCCIEHRAGGSRIRRADHRT